MRFLPPALILSVVIAIELPPLQPFLSALSLPITLQDYIPPSYEPNETDHEHEHELLKRQFSNTCPDNFDSCASLGAPGLCCASAAVCSPDAAGNVACCPTGVACSGTIGGVITQGTVNSDGSLINGGSTVPGGGAAGTASTTSFQVAGSTTTGNNGLVPAATTGTAATGSGNGFIVNSGSTVASPGAGMRSAQMPLMARAILKALEYLPI